SSRRRHTRSKRDWSSDVCSSDLEPLLAENAAEGWAELDWAELRQEVNGYRPTSMIDYPAPRIARIKLSGDSSLEGRRVQGHGRGIELAVFVFLTLVFEPARGWRVFGIGNAVRPDQSNFGGSMLEEIQPYEECKGGYICLYMFFSKSLQTIQATLESEVVYLLHTGMLGGSVIFSDFCNRFCHHVRYLVIEYRGDNVAGVAFLMADSC